MQGSGGQSSEVPAVRRDALHYLVQRYVEWLGVVEEGSKSTLWS